MFAKLKVVIVFMVILVWEKKIFGKVIFNPYWTLNLDTKIELICITEYFYVVASYYNPLTCTNRSLNCWILSHDATIIP